MPVSASRQVSDLPFTTPISVFVDPVCLLVSLSKYVYCVHMSTYFILTRLSVYLLVCLLFTDTVLPPCSSVHLFKPILCLSICLSCSLNSVCLLINLLPVCLTSYVSLYYVWLSICVFDCPSIHLCVCISVFLCPSGCLSTLTVYLTESFYVLLT